MILLALIGFILVTVFLAWYVVSHDHGAREPLGALWGAFGFGIISLIIALALEIWLVHGPVLGVIPNGYGQFLSYFFAFAKVGIIEELAKFVPLALFIRRKWYFNEHTDGVIYFALAGSAFGLCENLGYLVRLGGVPGVARVVLLLFFHAATCGMVGFYFANFTLRQGPFYKVLLALLGVITLHGLYDFGLSTGLGIFIVFALIIAVLLNSGLFVYYARASKLDQAQGLSAKGHNRYCRHCGQLNPHLRIYCIHCGNQA